MMGTLYGVGVGPGDPELLTLKAVRIIETADVVAYPTNPSGHSQARTIAARWLDGQRELPIPMEFDCERQSARRAYAEAAERILETLAAGLDVAVLCEGDPLFYGSFIHLHDAIGPRASCIVVPGVCSIHAAAGVATLPLASGDDAIAVIPGAADDARIRHALECFETVAIIKPGAHRQRIASLVGECGREATTVYVESATREDERIVKNIRSLAPGPGPYFSVILVGRGSS